MMKRINLRRMAAIAVVAVLLLAVAWVLFAPAQDASSNRSVALLAPSFVSEASAESAAPTNFLADEAGISAYMKSSFPIDLSTVRDLYRTIEVETSDYMIGSMPVAGYLETDDVHVYVHVDGWILAYYLKTDPIAKIFDWRMYHDSGRGTIRTKLENTLVVIAGEVSVPFSGATYYDFRYPNALEMMLIVEWVYNGEDSFETSLPGTFAFYERSWSAGTTDDVEIWLNGVRLHYADENRFYTTQAYLSASQLLPDQMHTMEVRSNGDWGYTGLALAYRRP